MTAPFVIHHGECLEVLRTLPDCSIDSVVTDPPYGLSDHKPEEVIACLTAWLAGEPYLPKGKGSNFPKSLNVNSALQAMPPCTRRIGTEVLDDGGVVEGTVNPLGFGGAGVGAELASMALAGVAADTNGHQLESSAEAGRREPTVDARNESVIGHLDPIVLGPLDVARMTERKEVAGIVCSRQIQPKPLRNDVVNNQSVSAPTVGANAISGDDVPAQRLPSSALVSPLLATPRGVAAADHPGLIVRGHAGSRAVGPGATAGEAVSLEGDRASLADEVSHAAKCNSSGRGLQCAGCGGIVQERIPEALAAKIKAEDATRQAVLL